MTTRLDINDAMAEVAGAAGLSRQDLEGLQGQIQKAHDALEARRKSGELGFFALPFDTAAAEASVALGKKLADRFDNVVVLGIGGSSLGPRALFTSLCHPLHNLLPKAKRGGARLFFPDNSDPASFAALLETLDLKDTCFVAITKSGGTAETWSQLLIVRERLIAAFGEQGFKDRVIAVTDPSKGALRSVATTEGLQTLPVPPAVGGRFSVFTAVGLLPAAAAGVDVKALLAGAAEMAGRTTSTELFKNPAYLFTAIHYLMDTRHGRHIHVLMPYADALKELADWFVQLWAESLGKHRAPGDAGVGPTPLGALGATDQHSKVQLFMEGPGDKTVTFIGVQEGGVDVEIPRMHQDIPELAYLGGHRLSELLDIERRATAGALARRGRPNMTLTLDRVDAWHVGGLLMFLELATAYAGRLYGVNAFDQPGVELGKQFTYAMLGRSDAQQARQEWDLLPKSDPARIL